ncbi:GRP family sugar transporter [Enterococcus sp. HY326]|uniref:GRP family sugar transporter n=1 Tax=Enterococcus sp. HY326 TaxID=2971265 RepID=UPI00223F43B2|nr:GRP family sugar transporter [Enterococcus sp. HY326]
MDFLIALVPMVMWGSVGLVSGKIGGTANQQTLGMTLGALLFASVVFIIVRPVLTWWTILIGVVVGICWSAGQNGQFHAMKHLGVSVGLPMSTGMQLVLNTIAGAVLFHEWTRTKDFVLGIAALILLVLGAYLTARQDDQSQPRTPDKMLDFGKGLRALVYSTLGYGAYTIIVTWADLDALAIILPMSIGMNIGALSFAAKKLTLNQYVWKNMISGLMWGLGNVCLLVTVQTLGLAVSFSLSQMGIIISTLGGIFILHERKTKKELLFVIFGCLSIIAGGILLGYMRA